MTGPDQPDQPEFEVESGLSEVETDTQLAPSDAEPPSKRGAERVFVGTGLVWGLGFGLILAVAFIVLASQNTGEVQVKFLNWEITTPLFALILVSFLVGVVVDELVGLVYRARRRRILQEREELRARRNRDEQV